MTAPDRIALRWELGAAVTSGPLMDHPDYTQYVRADLVRPAPLAEEWRDHDKERAEAAEAKVAALVEALEFYADENGYDVEVGDYGLSLRKGPTVIDAGDRARAAIRAIGERADG